MVEILSRMQFAFTIAFHFIFVPLTVGLIILILIFEIRYYRKGDERIKKLSNYFSDIFLINYAFGIVTGIAMTIQFGTNWAGYSIAMGEVFGSPLILEAIVAFFLESTFNGIWLFRRNKLTKKLRLIVVSMITIGTTLSALWIITANGFMQNPVGAYWNGSQMILTDFAKIVFNPYAWYMLIHNHTSALVLTGFVVLAISSWHLLKGKEEDKELFAISAKYAAWMLLISSILMPIIGNSYMDYITPLQPDKIAMITGTASGGLKTVVRIAFGVMVGLGSIFIFLNLKNSLNESGKTFISRHLPLSSVGISLLETFELEPVTNIPKLSVSYILLSHLLQFGMFCISSRKICCVSFLKVCLIVGSNSVKNSVFSGILSSSKFMYTSCSLF